ncbi:MAG: AAA family ATPase [Dactylosporangium sp.]|nr:AAA family ATPase [Dactylosporangium sp.]NNJ61173.1 AAA family ATPase [Dactylosporangium sp.]
MTDATRDEEIAEEQRYLDRVYARLAQLRESAAEAEKAGYGIAAVGNFGAYVERDAMVFHAARRRRALDAEHEGLVFGRLDFGPDASTGIDVSNVEPAVPGGEVRYIGRLGLRDERYETVVVDWRAPAAAPFYRATPADPLGVVRRRTIRSSDEQIVDISDDLLDPGIAPKGMAVVGDGALLASLVRATGRGMRDIVATIQREQDEAIRSPASGVTVVRGGPGTGKTAVALHRAAYLLYADRHRFESGGVLVVGPSEVFVSYVSRVLPSLGEDAVSLRSLGQLVVGHAATRHDPPEAAAIKGSLRMSRLLRRAARDTAPSAPDQLRLLYRGQLLTLDQRSIDAARRAVLSSGGRRNAVRPKAAGYLLDALWHQSVELLAPHRRQERTEFASDIAERREFITFMHSWWPRLRPIDVLGWLADHTRVERYGAGLLTPAEIDTLAGAYTSLADAGPSVADIALLDELGELLGERTRRVRPPRDPFHVMDGVREVTTYADRMAATRAAAAERPEDYRDYAHIVVDESQDVSPMQWRMIGRRGPHASWTVVGDPAQSAWPDPAEAARAMRAALGSRHRHDHALTTNYRNSAEIFELAAQVIRRAEPQIELPTAVRRGGVPPRHQLVTAEMLPQAARDAVAELIAEVEGTVGVITAMDAAEEVRAWLAGPLPDRLQVVGSLQAKGMEYDGVIVVDPARIRDEGDSGVRTLYVALSRATQRLLTVGTRDSWLPTSPGGGPTSGAESC